MGLIKKEPAKNLERKAGMAPNKKAKIQLLGSWLGLIKFKNCWFNIYFTAGL